MDLSTSRKLDAIKEKLISDGHKEKFDKDSILSVNGNSFSIDEDGAMWSSPYQLADGSYVDMIYNNLILDDVKDLHTDNVNHPSHYTQGGIECIEAIKASLGAEGFQAYCKGNIEKYLWRYEFKNGLEDLKKARWYLDRLIKEKETENGKETVPKMCK